MLSVLKAPSWARYRPQELLLVLVIVSSALFAYLTMASATLYIDEQTYARLGYSLLHGHLASDSSFLSIYQKYGLVRNDIITPYGYLDSVEPWLDHPPLVGILVIPIFVIGASPRLLPITFSSLSTIMIFFLLRERRLLAWASSLVWLAFFTTHQILSMFFLDAGVSFFNLLTVVLTAGYLRTHSKTQLYLAGLAAGASALSKEIGVASILYLLGFVFYTTFRQHRERLVSKVKYVVLSAGVASVWPLYGLAVSMPVFVQLFWINASRSVLSDSAINLATFVSFFSYTQSSLYFSGADPMLIIGWIAAAFSLRKRDLRLVAFSFLSTLSVVLITRYVIFYTIIPFFPFLAIGVGSLIVDSVKYLRGWTF